MDPIRNPFAPGAGTPPPEFAGRARLIEQARVALARIKAGRSEKCLIVTGLRGVGKTVLLSRMREQASELGYRVSFVEAHEDKPLPALLVPELRAILLELDRAGTLSEAVKRGLRVFRGFASALKLKYEGIEIGLDLDPEAGVADSGDLEADLPAMFLALGRAAKSRGVAIALLVDEIQYLREAEMSALIMALHRTAQESLPVLMMAAGLPQVQGLTGRSKSYSERLFDFPRVGPLDPADAIIALRDPAREQGADFSDDALDAIIAVTQGYPFFLQEWGYAAWNLAAGPVIHQADAEAATAVAIRRLDESFFRVRFDRLTPREKDYLRAMAELGPGPHRSGDIAELLGVPVTSAGPVRANLIRKGMIYGPAHGDTAFTVPLFDQFMRREIPSWPGRP